MLITDRFVMLNFPKTGSTFARQAILKAHAPTWADKIFNTPWPLNELMTRPHKLTDRHRNALAHRPRSQHGTYNQIPAEHRGKTVMSVVRNPIERLISTYEFKDWQQYPILDEATLRERFPSFPALNFQDYLEYRRMVLAIIQPPGLRTTVGPLTTQFITFYARDPLSTLMQLNDDVDLAKDYDKHFPRISFLHTENLNQELHDFLLNVGYPRRRIKAILTMGKRNTTKRTQRNYLTAEHVEHILYKERFFFQLFPEYLPN